MQIKTRVNYRSILSHAGLWLLYVIYQAISYGWENTDELSFRLAPQVIAVMVPVTIILTYMNLDVLMPAFYSHRKYGIYLISVVAALLIGGLTVRFLTYQFIIPWEQLHDLPRYKMENKNFWIPVRIFRISLEPIPIMAITMVINIIRNTFNQDKKIREIELARLSAEMKLLKAQINPHFLFNTLNSLYALTLKASDSAPGIVLRLSDLMHYMLYETKSESVKLTDEVSYLENYISIEQMRFADRVDLSFNFTGDSSGKMIAPLLLLTFVENAFKHGIEEGTGWIRIDLKVHDKALSFHVENSFPHHITRNIKGQGLDNLKKRLDLIYPGNYQLNLTENKQTFTADLKINYENH